MKNLLIIFFISLFYCATSESLAKFFGISNIQGSRLAVVYIFLFIGFTLNNCKLNVNKYYGFGILLITFYLIIDLLINNNYLPKIYGYASSTSLFWSYILFSSIKISYKEFNKILILLLFFLVGIALPSIIMAIVSKTSLRDAWFLYRELGQLGLALNFGLLASLFLSVSYKKYFIRIALVITVLIIMTTLKKSMLEALAIWVIFFYNARIRPGKLSGKFLAFSMISIIFSIYLEDIFDDIAANIYYYQNFGEDHVRLKMYITALQIMIDYMPFGAGFATFGSPSSILNGYSNIYYDYGIDKISEMSPRAISEGVFTLFDTFWPHIFGELGLFFGIIYLYLFIYPALRVHLSRAGSFYPDLSSNLGFVVFGAVTLLFMDGFALYSPENPLFILLYGLITGVPSSLIISGQSHKPLSDN